MNQSDESHQRQYVRFLINLCKVAAVILSLLAVQWKLGDTTYTHLSAASFAIIVMSMAYAVSSLLDISMESIDIAAAIVFILSVLLLLVGIISFAVFLFRGEMFSRPYSEETVVSLLGLLFVVSSLMLAVNDAEMEGFASGYFYGRRGEQRHGRMSVHLIFIVMPYVFGFQVMSVANTHLSRDGSLLVLFFYGLCLLLFIAFDEYQRHSRHWSIFWKNKALST